MLASNFQSPSSAFWAAMITGICWVNIFVVLRCKGSLYILDFKYTNVNTHTHTHTHTYTCASTKSFSNNFPNACLCFLIILFGTWKHLILMKFGLVADYFLLYVRIHCQAQGHKNLLLCSVVVSQWYSVWHVWGTGFDSHHYI